MKFCSKCNNKTDLTGVADDYYYECKTCGYVDRDIKDNEVLIDIETRPSGSLPINPDLIHSKAYARTTRKQCACGSDNPEAVIVMDNDTGKTIYICVHCQSLS